MSSCHCDALRTIERSWANGRFTAIVRIRPDYDPLPPDYWGNAPQFVQTRTARELEDQLTEAFGADRYGYPSPRAEKARSLLAAGQVVKDHAGNWYYGVVEYRHSDSMFVLCQSDRHLNIRRSRGWMGTDARLDGWIKVSRQTRVALGIHGRKGVEAAARRIAVVAIRDWENYINGCIVGYEVELMDECRLAEEASCGGYPDIDEAEDAAQEVLSIWIETYH
jgi:hypothetical protein